MGYLNDLHYRRTLNPMNGHIEDDNKRCCKISFALTAHLRPFKIFIEYSYECNNNGKAKNSTPLFTLLEQQNKIIDWNTRNAVLRVDGKDQLDKLRRIVQQQLQRSKYESKIAGFKNEQIMEAPNHPIIKQTARKHYRLQNPGEQFHHRCEHVRKSNDDSVRSRAFRLAGIEKRGSYGEEIKEVVGKVFKEKGLFLDGNEVDDRLNNNRFDILQKDGSQKVEAPSLVKEETEEQFALVEDKGSSHNEADAPVPMTLPHNCGGFAVLATREGRQPQVWNHLDLERNILAEQKQRQQELQLPPQLQPQQLQSHQLSYERRQLQIEIPEQSSFNMCMIPCISGPTPISPIYPWNNAQDSNHQFQRFKNPWKDTARIQGQEQQRLQWLQQNQNYYCNGTEQMLIRQQAFFAQAQLPRVVLPPIDERRQFRPHHQINGLQLLGDKWPKLQQQQQQQQKPNNTVPQSLELLIEVNLEQIQPVLNHYLNGKKKVIMTDPMNFLTTDNEVVGEGVAGAVIVVRTKRKRPEQTARELVMKTTVITDYKLNGRIKLFDATLPAREVVAMSLNHPNLMTLDQVYLHQNKIFIVMQRMLGTLMDFMSKYGTFTEPFATHIIYEVTKGLAYLHESGFIHGDIKAENVLVSQKGEIKLADFGHAGLIGQPELAFRGTPRFIAPEVADETKYWDKSADLWSLGIMMIELIDGSAPKVDPDIDPNNIETLMQAHASIITAPQPVNPSVTLKYKTAMNQILQIRPTARATAQEFEKYLRNAISTGILSSASKEDIRQLLTVSPPPTASIAAASTVAASSSAFSASAANVDSLTSAVSSPFEGVFCE
ncbi:kinase-like domain-containing protein [Mycotypha africana]|uniref:kinase-like domain-containing protein n=1 Tax=Mycotypha africana TaxID=64632 RepID=UPI0023003520|nr:kinase-like domain-containing protein [Mycotypha africana]KAI8973320.1 kinase-like domain-containing protein [Mycotypha africana]